MQIAKNRNKTLRRLSRGILVTVTFSKTTQQIFIYRTYSVVTVSAFVHNSKVDKQPKLYDVQ